MCAVKSYFKNICNQEHTTTLTPLQIALQFISSYFKISVNMPEACAQMITQANLEELQSRVNLHFVAVEPSLSTIKKLSLFPVLMTVKDQVHFYIMEPSRRILYSTENIHTKLELNKISTLDIEQAWQCIPTALPIYTSLKQMMRGMWQYMRSDLSSVWLSIKASSLMAVLTPLISGYIFKHFTTLQTQHHAMIYLCFLLVFCSVNLILFNSDLKLKMINTKWLAMSMPSVWRHLLSLPVSSLQQYQSGSLAQLILDYEIAMTNLPGAVISLLAIFISLLSLLCYMLTCQAGMAVFFTCICLIALACKLYFLPQQITAMTNTLTAQAGLSQFTTEMLMQVQKIRSAGAEAAIFQRWLQCVIKTKIPAETAMHINVKTLMLDASLPLVMMLCVLLLSYAYPASVDTYLLLQFMLCAGQFFQLFEKLALQLNTLLQVTPALQRMRDFSYAHTELYDVNKPKPLLNHGQIEFKHVSLRRSHDSPFILRDVSLTIPAGKMVAITGRTGAGKSSLLKLLLGFESLAQGEIRIDNIPLQHWNLRDVRKNMGVVLQTSQLLPGSIYSNISLNHQVSHEEAWALAAKVNLDQDIAQMPMKMHTIISDNPGESLSGGQRQKILLARALAGKPSILLLDEATSALDNASQARITRQLQELNITRLVVAHRYSTIAAADWIVVLDQGHIADQGRYQDLLLRGHFQM